MMLLTLAALLQAPAADAAAAQRRPNIVLIVLDDVGVEKIGAYHERPRGGDTPCTPNIDALATEGLLFRNVWTDPVCSPTRAQILTGRHGFRTGIGNILEFENAETSLSTSELTLPRVLTGYDTSLVGKWHLTKPGEGALHHPLDCGFGWFAGTLFNISTPPVPCGEGCPVPDCKDSGPLGYRNWVKVAPDPETGTLAQRCTTTYATTDTANDAIARAQAMQAPWFLEVSFNAPHQPTQPPPPELYEKACPPREGNSQIPRFLVLDAMITALDTEIGRMLAAIRAVDPEVVVVLLADNGTGIPGAQGEKGDCFSWEHAKGTVYQAGIRVPMIAAGPGIVHGECTGLVSTTDLYATFAELAGVSSAAQDSVSLVPYLRGHPEPLRRTVYAESFRPNYPRLDLPDAPPFRPEQHLRAIRDARYKLIRSTRRGESQEELYDLQLDPCETRNLCPGGDTSALEPAQLAALEALRAELAALGVYE